MNTLCWFLEENDTKTVLAGDSIMHFDQRWCLWEFIVNNGDFTQQNATQFGNNETEKGPGQERCHEVVRQARWIWNDIGKQRDAQVYILNVEIVVVSKFASFVVTEITEHEFNYRTSLGEFVAAYFRNVGAIVTFSRTPLARTVS